MERQRKPLQGVIIIIRFNWHFYAVAISLVLILTQLAAFTNETISAYIYFINILIGGAIVLSLLVSLYVYDLSGFYNLHWLDEQALGKLVVNINAGFDETSVLLAEKLKPANLIALDFYDPKKHTEISIRRARKAYPAFPGTKLSNTNSLQLENNSADTIFVIFSAHEIRDVNERVAFFKELKRAIKPAGQIYIVEHLRDGANLLAYNIGSFHFYPKMTWVRTFQMAGLQVKQQRRLTPFTITFILEKNGNAF